MHPDTCPYTGQPALDSSLDRFCFSLPSSLSLSSTRALLLSPALSLSAPPDLLQHRIDDVVVLHLKLTGQSTERRTQTVAVRETKEEPCRETEPGEGERREREQKPLPMAVEAGRKQSALLQYS